jgi:hypothetical protein
VAWLFQNPVLLEWRTIPVTLLSKSSPFKMITGARWNCLGHGRLIGFENKRP